MYYCKLPHDRLLFNLLELRNLSERPAVGSSDLRPRWTLTATTLSALNLSYILFLNTRSIYDFIFLIC